MDKAKTQRIFLVRHAKPELPHDGRLYYGFTDYPLCADGIARAEQLRRDIEGIRFDGIFSSDLLRARRTAEIIAPERAADIKYVRELREVNLGDWEGKSYDEVRGEWNEIFEKRGAAFAETAPPNGESFKALQRRTVPAFEKILAEAPDGNILVVSHGGVMWTLMCHYFHFDLNDMFLYPTEYCSLHMLTRSDGVMRLIRYNWSSKLTESRLW